VSVDTRGLLSRWGIGVLSLAAGCSVDKFPVPSEFDAAFVTGTVCMPTQIQTGADAKFAVRFETCVYRCVQIDRTAGIHLNYGWACGGNVCQMALLATAHMLRVKGEDDCDARELPAPKPSECLPETVGFDDIDPPRCQGPSCDEEYLTGPFTVTIPYLDLDQGEDVVDRVSKGENVVQVVQEVVGPQRDPKRAFTVAFDPSYEQFNDPDALTGADCHEIPPP
jgi:hypothetical protein